LGVIVVPLNVLVGFHLEVKIDGGLGGEVVAILDRQFTDPDYFLESY
jgi:hypothetical protein